MNFVLRMLDDPMLFRQQAYVAGRWVASSNGETISVGNPFDEAEIGYVPACTREQVDESIDVAKPRQRKFCGHGSRIGSVRTDYVLGMT
ncbi:MAG: hypothetical protein ABF443_14905 [Acetobacter malorum]